LENCGPTYPWTWACPRQLGAGVITRSNNPSTKYSYWRVKGPGSSFCTDTAALADLPNLHDPEALKKWGEDQAQAFWDTYLNHHASDFGGNTLFADVENPTKRLTDGSNWACDWGDFGDGLPLDPADPKKEAEVANQQYRNGLVLNAFLYQLQILAREHDKQIGVYANLTTIPTYMGSAFSFSVPIVLWVAYKLDKNQADPLSSDFNEQIVTKYAPKIFCDSGHSKCRSLIARYYPVIWQFYGDQGDMTIQDPTLGFTPIPDTSPDRRPRGFYPQTIHVDYYNDVQPAEITLEAPINWNTPFTPVIASGDIKTINFNWGTNSPAPGVNGVFWSAVFTGMLQVPHSGYYIFYLEHLDDGGRLIVNNRTIIDKWRVQGNRNYFGYVYLYAGQVPIRIEYAQGPPLDAGLSVYWSSTYFLKELIGPASQ